MTHKQLFISLGSVLLLAGITVSPFLVNTYALEEGSQQPGTETISGHRRHHNRDVINAIKAGDYEAWKTAVSETERGDYLLSKINADNFDTFVQMHELYHANDIEAADALAQQLGLPTKAERESLREAIRQALKNNDYQAYLDAVNGNEEFPDELIMSEEEFTQKAERVAQRNDRRSRIRNIIRN